MENLTFNSNKKLDTTSFVRIGDLSYFEGPLLSLFKELNSGHFYIFDWVDRDQKSNRWIIYRASPEYLLNFLNRKLAYSELFESRLNNEIYFADIDSHNKPFFYYDAFQIESLPDTYLPNKDIFFEQSDCNAFEKIRSVIIDSLSQKKSKNEYSRIYRAHILKNKENKLIHTVYHMEHSKFFNFEIRNNLISDNIGYEKFRTYSSFKRKEHAN